MKTTLLLFLIIFTSCATNNRQYSSCKETIIHEMVRNGDTIVSTEIKNYKHDLETLKLKL